MATLETWYSPDAGELKVGPGTPSDLAVKPDPWTVLRFVRGLLTVDTEDAHYPDWRKWLDASAGAYGLRIVTEDDAAEHLPFNPADLSCPETVETDINLAGSRDRIVAKDPCPFRAPTIREVHQHLLAVHKPKVSA